MKKLILIFLFFPYYLAGQIWKPLGSGFDLPAVNDMLLLNNELYAGGPFFMAGITNVNTIAKWNGTTWLSLNFIPYLGGVTSVGKFNNDLIVAGDFQGVNGNLNSRRIARYDGSTWHSLNTGINVGGSHYCFIEYNGDLLVGGDIDIVDGQPVQNLVRWDGTSWHSFANVTGTFAQVSDMIVFNNELYIGGYFSSVNGQTMVNIAKFDGTTWSDVGGGLSSDVLVFAIDSVNNRLYAAGNFNGIYNSSTFLPSSVAYWDGSNWNAVGGTPAISPRALCFYKNNLYAGFAFDAIKPNGDTLKHMAVWDGNEWQPTNGNLDDIVKDFCVLNNNLIVGGAFIVAGDSVVNYIAAYTDTTTTGIFNIQPELEQLIITPNPTRNSIQVISPFNIGSYEVTTQNGQTVSKQRLKASKHFVVDTSTLDSGTYIITVAKGNKQLSRQFVKE